VAQRRLSSFETSLILIFNNSGGDQEMSTLSKVESKTESKIDLAGYCHSHPHYLQTRARINYLIERYLSLNILSEQLQDLPLQFEAPHQRAWQRINWKAINPNQIVGIDPKLFLFVLVGAVEIEAPVRDYSRESWNYFQGVHPQMAHFMGGMRNEASEVVEVSIWEKEERQHAPVFSQIYKQLTGLKLQPKPNSVKDYYPTENPITEIYKHTVSRISTEWSAASVYLWLMAHSTGELQNAIAQPLQDEIGHLAKFWGFACWAFSDSFIARTSNATSQLMGLLKHHRGERSHSNDILQRNTLVHAAELAFTFTRIMSQMYRWNGNLKTDHLELLFGESPNSFQNTAQIAAV
jgi:hypothetical protein